MTAEKQASYKLPDLLVLKELIESCPYPLRHTSVSWKFDCPRCGKRDRLYIRKRDGRFVCFYEAADGFRGAPEYVLNILTGKSVEELQGLLYKGEAQATELLEGELEDHYEEKSFEEDEKVYPEVSWPEDSFAVGEDRAKAGEVYLAERGVSVQLAQKYQVRYYPQQSRVLFPVTRNGLLVGWQGRYRKQCKVWNDGVLFEVPKYLSTKGMVGGDLLMFEHNLEGSEKIVLCEGPLDALKADLCRGNVATMGKSVTGKQLRRLLSFGARKVYLALDPDAAAEAQGLLSELETDVELYDMTPAEDTDLGAMSRLEVRRLFDLAPRLDRHKVFFFLADPYA